LPPLDSDNSDGERPSSPTRRTADDEEGCSPAERVQVPALSSYSDNIESQLFSSFVSLAYSLALEEPQESSVVDLLDRLRHKDLGVLSTHLLTVGYGSSFVVSRFSSQDDIPDLDLIVLKRTIPTTASQSEYRVQKRVKSLMIELRVLTHDPIRKHENIIKFLGIAWETDPLDLQRKWPVLIMERATYGTLSDFLNTPGSKSPLTKLSLALDVVRGLQILHRCGVLHGDIKTDNVLVLENRDPDTQDERPIIAKLGDFSGVLFDMKDHMAIPSGTQPWNAPEWRQSLPPALLLKTDVYSLGFLIYRIMTNGKYPFRDLPKEPSWTKVETMKRDADKMLEYMKSLSVSQDNFNLKDLHAMLDQTLRNDPNLRDLNEVESILQKLTHPNR
jgi:serine/threonine protein kinase